MCYAFFGFVEILKVKKNRQWLRSFLRFIENYFDFDLPDLESAFPSLERFPKLSFQDGEYRFDFVSLMILFLAE
jgi:hypothetical protein